MTIPSRKEIREQLKDPSIQEITEKADSFVRSEQTKRGIGKSIACWLEVMSMRCGGWWRSLRHKEDAATFANKIIDAIKKGDIDWQDLRRFNPKDVWEVSKKQIQADPNSLAEEKLLVAIRKADHDDFTRLALASVIKSIQKPNLVGQGNQQVSGAIGQPRASNIQEANLLDQYASLHQRAIVLLQGLNKRKIDKNTGEAALNQLKADVTSLPKIEQSADAS